LPATTRYCPYQKPQWELVMKILDWLIGVLLAMLPLVMLPAYAQMKDKPGGKDHPLVSRFEGSVLNNFGGTSFEQVDLPLARYESTAGPAKPSKSLRVEGKVMNYDYWGPAGKSDLEVFRNYQGALSKSGFTLLYVCDEPRRCEADGLGKFAADWSSRPTTFLGGYSPTSRYEENGNYPPRFLVAQLKRPQGDVYVNLTVQAASSTQQGKSMGGPYFLQVIEVQAMRTDAVTVDANAMQKGLAADGKIALYGVLFDTGSAVVKPESKAQLDEMARLMTSNAAARFFIVGHTDNVGELQANTSLSQRRADAVAASLAQGYKIDARRLIARGVANLSPVASNESDAGRTKNRRVELVLQ
jgi:OmpA-OmpF porin, OOP family